ncbi:MAG: prephenate dehydrogenase/arogenate dehydrogenase family protein [Myxococcota bacterium]
MNENRVAVMGHGRFGSAFSELLERAHFTVRAFDPLARVPPHRRAETWRDAAREARFVVLAVPLPALEGVLIELIPELRPNQTVFDVGSVKVPVQELFQQALGRTIPWVCTHPVFGPLSLLRGEGPARVVVCPNEAHPDAVDAVEALYRKLECVVVELTPQAHDRLMAESHALAFFVAKGLLDIGAAEDQEVAPPSFRAMLQTVASVKEDAGHLFQTIHRDNPYASEARARFLRALHAVHEQLQKPEEPDGSSPNPLQPGLPPAPLPPGLQETRAFIDALDQELIELLARRARLSRRAGHSKDATGHPVRDPDREAKMLKKRADWARQADLPVDETQDVFEAVLRLSRSLQRR